MELHSQIYSQDQDIKMGANGSQEQLFTITISEGDTQSQELFDYTSSNPNSETSSLSFPSMIAETNERLVYSRILSPVQSQLSQPMAPLYEFSMTGYRELHFRNIRRGQDKTIWKVVRDSQLIEPGDVIKIGKVKLEIKEIVLAKSRALAPDRRDTTLNQNRTTKTQSLHESMVSKDEQCRVCFDSHNTGDNPLLSLCKCTGTVKFIHFQCLKDWTSHDITTKQMPNCLQHSYLESRCQICKQVLQNEFAYEGKKYTLFNLVNLDKIPQPYVRFQTRETQNGRNRISVFFARLLDNTELVIGRNNVSDIMMKDISVSRAHCSLFFKNKMLFVKDKGSKFGTLVKVKKEVQFNNQTGLELQYHSRLLKISQNRVMQNCCCAEVDSYRVVFDDNPESNE